MYNLETGLLLIAILLTGFILGRVFQTKRMTITNQFQSCLSADRNPPSETIGQQGDYTKVISEEGVEGYFLCDLGEIVTYLNKGAGKILGYNPQELIGKNLTELFEPNIWTKFKQDLSHKREQEIRQFQTTLLGKGQLKIEVALRVLPLYQQQKVTGSIYILTEISAIKKIEGEFAQRTEELTSLIKLGAMMTSTLSLREVLDFIVKEVTEFSQADACTLRLLSEDKKDLILQATYGVDPKLHPEQVSVLKSVTGKAILEKRVVIVADLNREESYQSMQAATLQGMSSLLCAPLIVKGEPKGAFCLYTRQPCHFSQHQIDLVKALADQAAIALDNARLYAREQQTVIKLRELNQAKSDFLSMVSHELRTPLTSIKGYTSLMLAGRVGNVNEEQKKFLKIVETQSDHLTTLITDLLDLSRIEAGQIKMKRAAINLKSLVETLVERLHTHFEQKNITVETRLPTHIPFVFGDKDKLNQVLANILTNALKFTPEGGRVEIGVFEKEGNLVQVQVKDTGIGIPPEELNKIFEKFYQVDSSSTRQTGGAGLGLAIVKRIIEMHNGKVWAESAGLYQGSTFCFSLPIFQQASTEETIDIKTTSAQTKPLPGQKTVLVVDDEQDVINLFKIYLEDEGYRVIWAFTGQQAIEQTRREKPDVVTLDIRLPDMEGLQVLRTLKQDPLTKDIPVIILSIMPDQEAQARDLGVAEYFVKPIERSKFIKKIKEIIELSKRKS